MNLVIEIIKELRGPICACTWEWPEYCDGYNLELCPEMGELLALLPLRGETPRVCLRLARPQDKVTCEETLADPGNFSRDRDSSKEVSQAP